MVLIDALGDHLDEALQIERFEDGVADSLRGNLFHAALSGGGEDDDVGPGLAESAEVLQELVAVDPRHHQVEQDQVVGTTILKAREPGLSVLGQLDGEIHPRQHRLQQHPNRKIIVNDQNLSAAPVDLQMLPSRRYLQHRLVTANVMQSRIFPFRGWVRKAGASIVLVAAAVTGVMLAALTMAPSARYGWIGEPFVWLYVGALWAGGLRIWIGTRGPVARIGESDMVLRPLHTLRARRIDFAAVRGTEQMRRGDRLVLYYDTARGMRFVALNLNLIKGRREFLACLEQRLTGMGFVERLTGDSRYLSPAP